MLVATRACGRTLHRRFAHNIVKREPAKPHTPAHIGTQQSPNRATTWSTNQAARTSAMVGPRFEQTAETFQPRPLAAIEMIHEEPVRLVPSRIAACDGGGGALGHPRVFINLDKPGTHACNYCGLRFEMDPDHHHH
ncbi:hypothetical protein ACM66B_001061 [Microbotryomycetes sp. NB124-2]